MIDGPISKLQSESLLIEARSTPADNAVLRDMANGTLREAVAQQHIIRLMLQCADLRRRLEGMSVIPVRGTSDTSARKNR